MSIDLGTANTLIYTKEDGIVLNEPSIVAVEIQGESLVPYAFGKDAKVMIGKTPGKIQSIRPLKDGVIADFKITESMIKHFIKSVNKSGLLFKPKNIDDLVEKLLELINNKNNRIKYGIAGRKLVIKNFDKKIINKKIINIYKNLIKNAER